MTTEPTQQPGAEPKKKPPVLALALAFLPSVMGLGLLTIYGNRSTPPAVLFGVCCLASAVMLIKRKTWLIVLVGVLFLFLNLGISFFFGCAAVLSNAFGHP